MQERICLLFVILSKGVQRLVLALPDAKNPPESHLGIMRLTEKKSLGRILRWRTAGFACLSWLRMTKLKSSADAVSTAQLSN